MSLRPIFIGGCERSGTTMLGAMLGAAPGAITVPESGRLRIAGAKAMEAGGTATDALRAMTNHSKFRAWSTGETDSEQRPPRDLRDAMEILVRRYAASRRVVDPQVWIDHTPVNIMHARTSAIEYPDARFVHIVRDGRATAASLMRSPWGPNTILSAAAHWKDRIAHGLALETSTLAHRVLRVRYEDLLASPEATLKRVCDACDLAFCPEMLRGGRFEVPEITRYQHALVGSPPDLARASAWEAEMTPREVEMFETSAGEMLAMLGYEVRVRAAVRRITGIERMRMGAIEWYRGQILNPRIKRRSEQSREASRISRESPSSQTF